MAAWAHRTVLCILPHLAGSPRWHEAYTSLRLHTRGVPRISALQDGRFAASRVWMVSPYGAWPLPQPTDLPLHGGAGAGLLAGLHHACAGHDRQAPDRPAWRRC